MLERRPAKDKANLTQLYEKACKEKRSVDMWMKGQEDTRWPFLGRVGYMQTAIWVSQGCCG